jgi:tetratricopeptide (TPR) repeat protein
MFENLLLTEHIVDKDILSISLPSLTEKIGDYVENYLELSIDYANCGLWQEAIDVLKLIAISGENIEGSRYPMVYYYLAWYYSKLTDPGLVMHYLNVAADMPTDYCFPFRHESMEILNFAIKSNPEDGNAYYYLGNLLFEWQPINARKAWEASVAIDDNNPIAFRNLGMAYHMEGKFPIKALSAYKKAVNLRGSDQRLLYEQDLIMAAYRVDPVERLQILQEHHESIANNNVSDALSREVMLLVQLGQYDKALKVLQGNYFRQWEGVSKAYSSYVDAYLLKGLEFLKEKDYKQALVHFNQALEYPENMMVAQPYRGGRECEVNYYIGLTYEHMNKSKKAVEAFQLSADRRLNEDLSDIYFFRAMSLNKLGELGDSNDILEELVEIGQDRLKSSEVDFFAKFGEKETAEDKAANAWYLIGLGYLGLDDKVRSQQAFKKAIELNINHTWARAHLQGITVF